MVRGIDYCHDTCQTHRAMARRPQPMRVKPPSGPEGRWGRFLVAQRELAGLTQKATFELFREDLGWAPDSRASYGDLERGKRQPDADEQRYLLSHYGIDELPSDEPATPAETPDLAAAIVALTEELRAMRQERETQEERFRALEAAVSHLMPPDGEGSPEQSVLHGTTG